MLMDRSSISPRPPRRVPQPDGFRVVGRSPGTTPAELDDAPTREIWNATFGLRADPFSLTPDPAYFYRSPQHAEALAGLKLGLWERRGLLVMIGEVGTGKTTLAYSLLSDLELRIETAYVANTLLAYDEILELALDDFGVDLEGTRRLDLLAALNRFLTRCALAGRCAALVLDEAHNLPDEIFEQIRLLLNFETYERKLLQIVLIGQPELGARLRTPRLRQIGDRAAVYCRLEPFDRRQARAYLAHRLAVAGGSTELFTRPALRLLIRKSRGVPRRLNVLAHNAMLFAYGRELRRVDWRAVTAAVRERR